MNTHQLLQQFKNQASGQVLNISEKQLSFLKSLAIKEGLFASKLPAAFGKDCILQPEADCLWLIRPLSKQVANSLRGSHSVATGRFELSCNILFERNGKPETISEASFNQLLADGIACKRLNVSSLNQKAI